MIGDFAEFLQSRQYPKIATISNVPYYYALLEQ
jgi:hypothetical protein